MPTKHGPCRAGLEATLKAMDVTKPLAAMVAAARGLADAVDADPANAALWREYRAFLGQLTEAATSDDDDGTAAIQVTFRTPRIRG